MSNEVRMPPGGSPIAGAPTWLRVLQAALIGVVAGLALHALFSIVVLQGSEAGQGRPAPSQCRKNTAPRDAASPKPGAPRISGVDAYMPLALDGGTIPFILM